MMSRMRWTTLALVLTSACATVSSGMQITGPAGPPRPPDAPVAAYFNGQEPPRHVVEVARIRVDSVESPGVVMAVAARRARQVGADAILVDFRWHYHSIPVTVDAMGAPHLPPTPRLNADVVAVRFAP